MKRSQKILPSQDAWFEQSHYIRTPTQAGPYQTSHPWEDTPEDALNRARNTARSHFVEFVVEGFSRFAQFYTTRQLGLRKDTDKAAHVAEALLDLPEHVHHELGNKGTGYTSGANYRKSLWSTSRAYKVTCDFANVKKHRNIDRNDPLLRKIDGVKEVVALVRYSDKQGVYYRSRKLLQATLSDGSEHDLGELLRESVLLWSDELRRLGIVPRQPALKSLLPRLAPRDDPRFQGPFRLLATKGEYCEFLPKLLVYRSELDAITTPRPGERVGKRGVQVEYVLEVGPSLFET